MFEVKTVGDRVYVRGNGHRTSFRVGPTAFRLTRVDEQDPRVAIVRELQLLGRVLHRLYPEQEPPQNQVPERWPAPPRHLVREFVRLCSALTPVLDQARAAAGERVVQTQEAVLKATGSVPPLLLTSEFFDDPHLAEDLARYPAAVVAAQYLVPQANPRDNVRKLRRWRALFSPSGRSYKSLNVTLDAVKRDFTPRLLPELRRIKLHRPILDPTHLKVLLRTVHALSRVRRHDVEPVLRIVANAKLEELRGAFERVAEHCNFADPHHLSHLADRRLVRLLLGVEPTRGMRLRGLVDAAIRLEREQEIIEAVREVGGADRPTAKPPIPLPQHAELRFLSTVAEILAESRLMQHCIHTYARGAVLGTHYLFHVEHLGQHATAQVDVEGELVSVQGPRNSENEAVERAKELLAPWGEKLAERLGVQGDAGVDDPRQARLFDFFDGMDVEDAVELLEG